MKHLYLLIIILIYNTNCFSQSAFPNGSIFQKEYVELNEYNISKVISIINKFEINANNPAYKALIMLGTPYKYGGNDEIKGQDCSSFVLYSYKEAGIILPRTAKQIASQSTRIPLTKIKPGDMLFFNTTGTSASHVGIYIGDNLFAHAPSTGKLAKIEKISDTYWRKKYQFSARHKNLIH